LKATLSPIQASESGMAAAANAPVAIRAPTRISSEGAKAQATLAMAAIAIATTITGSLPTRSPRGPKKSCVAP
jgi:hypothetical protein